MDKQQKDVEARKVVREHIQLVMKECETLLSDEQKT